MNIERGKERNDQPHDATAHLAQEMEEAVKRALRANTTTIVVPGSREAVMTFDTRCYHILKDKMDLMKKVVGDGPSGADDVFVDEQMKGVGRNAVILLDRPRPILGKEILCARGKGLLVDPLNLDVEFDLFDVYRRMGEDVNPAGMHRVDVNYNELGFAVSSRHVNEPMGGLFLRNAENEFHMGRRILDVGFACDIPLAYGRFTNFKSPKGQELGFVFMGIINLDKRGDRLLTEINQHYLPKVEGGDGAAKDMWRHDVEEVSRGWGLTLRQLHDFGFTHGNPHIGNFRFRETVTVCDLHDMHELRYLTRPQAFGYVASDLRNMLTAGERLERNRLYQTYDIHPLKAAIRGYFFDRMDKVDIEGMMGYAERIKHGVIAIDDLFGEAERASLIEMNHPFIRLIRETMRVNR